MTGAGAAQGLDLHLFWRVMIVIRLLRNQNRWTLNGGRKCLIGPSSRPLMMTSYPAPFGRRVPEFGFD
jgi:hypothetical protein